MSVLPFPTRSRRGRARLVQVVITMVADVVRAWRARQADRALSLLSDALLHDIGVSRSEISDVVRHGRTSRGALHGAPRAGSARRTLPGLKLT